MRIGIVSDTHLYDHKPELPAALVEGLSGVDLILHAGDWIAESIVDRFAAIAPVDGIAGNNDGPGIVRRFGRSKVLELAGYRIGLVHGDGGRSTPDTAYRTFCASGGEASVDIVLFGHSHIPYQDMRGGVLLFNPGSPTDKRRQDMYSYGILELTEQIGARHYYYTDRSPAKYS
ncbi:metallophosphoesterase family protein [Paenibacillus puerhi]|uniref:metallophosphoesterase family protein n=1 Tax=Paenibacillus puerhi TaxID=2692622 RepID=UPI0013595B16|nr:metallophosphoesterase family protein [Paenibacillus puerhi]